MLIVDDNTDNSQNLKDDDDDDDDNEDEDEDDDNSGAGVCGLKSVTAQMCFHDFPLLSAVVSVTLHC